MPIVITNTLTQKHEAFNPINPPHVTLYVCGPTVYNYTHIGNARPPAFFDVVERHLKYRGYDVKRVMNYTDVDDKIINRSIEEKSSCEAITEKYIKAFEEDMAALHVRPPFAAPRVTQVIPQIISVIEGLIQNQYAYVTDEGEVLYSVRNFKDYGKLSGKKIDDLIAGARVALDEKKRDPLDFSLWKPRKKDNEPAWESPWGLGRPGWHIECSAMVLNILGPSIDIHGGGMDLIHPHHENEIAQSEGYSKKPLAKYWMHSNMLCFNSEKMSKSVGNIFLTRDFIKKYTAETLRYLLLSAHYRSTIDFSESHIRDTQLALHRVYSTLLKCQTLIASPPTSLQDAPVRYESDLASFEKTFESLWSQAMDEDFNTAKALGFVFEYVRTMNRFIDQKPLKLSQSGLSSIESFVSAMKVFGSILNLFEDDPETYLKTLKGIFIREQGIDESWIEAQISQRTLSRQNKDFAKADQIRKDLLVRGIELRDSGNETQWDLSFSEAKKI